MIEFDEVNYVWAVNPYTGVRERARLLSDEVELAFDDGTALTVKKEDESDGPRDPLATAIGATLALPFTLICMIAVAFGLLCMAPIVLLGWPFVPFITYFRQKSANEIKSNR